MPPGLLTLSNETLQQIGSHLPSDDHVPIPAFRPHWANYAPRLHPNVSRDIRSARSACRRLREALPPPGLHVEIKTSETLTRWVLEASEESKQRVTRVRVAWKQASLENLIFLWSTLISFLNTLPNLVELQLVETPFCVHDPHGNARRPPKKNIFDAFRIPPFSVLAKLSALSIEIACQVCNDEFSDLLLPAVPNLRHLRLSDEDVDHGFAMRRLDCFDLEPMFANLKTLTLRVETEDPDFHIAYALDKVANALPQLLELHIIPYSRRCELEVSDVHPSCWLNVTQKSARWTCYASREKTESAFTDWLDTMSAFENLQVCDLGIALSVNGHPRPPQNDFLPRRGQAEREFRSPHEDTTEAEYQHLRGVAARVAAERLAKACPKLRRGAWWSDVSCQRRDEKVVATRLGWTVVRSPLDGTIDIRLDPVTFRLTEDFSSSSEGSVTFPVEMAKQIRCPIKSTPLVRRLPAMPYTRNDWC